MSKSNSGFTLLEILVALVVFGFVMAGITQTLRFGLAAWPSGARGAAKMDELATLDAALSRMIAEARPGSMIGQDDTLALTTRLPAGAGFSGFADVNISRAANHQIIMLFGPHAPGVLITELPPPKVEPLAQEVARLTITYLVPQAHNAPVWSNSWIGGGLPLLVRFHFDFVNGQVWPDLVMAPVGQDE